MKQIKTFILLNKESILSNNSKKGGDIDFIDKKKNLRNKIYKIIKKNNLIYAKRYHATGVRYDIITKKLGIYSLDFLNGYETNPFFFEFSKKKSNHKIKVKINYNLFKKNFDIFILNFFKYFLYRFCSLIYQKPALIEFYGVDGSGKSYFSNILEKKLNKRINLKIFHSWKKRSKKNKQLKPYLRKNYILPVSLIKEIFILFKIIFFYIYINLFTKRKCLYVFERSLHDTYLDPERYRISHNPIIISFFLQKIFFKTFKILINSSYKKINLRKNELNYDKFVELNKLFRNIKFNLIIKN
tara:strand:+ start:6759 stop:7655 length:897 start_codon:yes stop_codon:yes gene_type:complete